MDSKTKALRKDYGQLTPHERFRLVLAASERGDMGEIEALAKACPRKVYEDMDYQYTERMRTLMMIAADYLIMQFSTQVLAWRMLGMSDREHFVDQDETGERAGDLAFKLMDVMATYRAAFEGFCGELGITPEQALDHVPTYKFDESVRLAFDVMDALAWEMGTPKTEAAERWKEAWRGLWDHRLS